MVRSSCARFAFATIALLVAVPAASADGFASIRWSRNSAIAVRLEASGLGEDRRDRVAESEPCTTFRPTPAAVANYFARARQITKRQFLEETDFSACHVTGNLRLRDGRAAEWTLLRGGSAVVRVASTDVYLLCEPCLERLDPRRP